MKCYFRSLLVNYSMSPSMMHEGAQLLRSPRVPLPSRPRTRMLMASAATTALAVTTQLKLRLWVQQLLHSCMRQALRSCKPMGQMQRIVFGRRSAIGQVSLSRESCNAGAPVDFLFFPVRTQLLPAILKQFPDSASKPMSNQISAMLEPTLN